MGNMTKQKKGDLALALCGGWVPVLKTANPAHPITRGLEPECRKCARIWEKSRE